MAEVLSFVGILFQVVELIEVFVFLLDAGDDLKTPLHPGTLIAIGKGEGARI